MARWFVNGCLLRILIEDTSDNLIPLHSAVDDNLEINIPVANVFTIQAGIEKPLLN